MTRSTAFLSLAMVPTLIGVLALGAAPALAWDSETIGDNGDPADRYDIVFLGDGYRASEMSKFRADTDAVVAYLTGTVNPFKDYRRCFNFHRVLVESVESGVDHPAQGISRNTALDCTYSFSGVERCVLTSNSAAVFAAASDAPDYDKVMIIVNDSQYGGCAWVGGFGCSYNGPDCPAVIAHELGHAMGSVGDEYQANAPWTGGDPGYVNLDDDGTLATVKWAVFVTVGTLPTPPGTPGVGAFEGGAGGYSTGVYRPVNICMMRNHTYAYCPVCYDAMLLFMYQQASAAVGATPTPGSTIDVSQSETRLFTVDITFPAADALLEWRVNSTLVQSSSSTSFTLDGSLYGVGAVSVTCDYADATPSIKRNPTSLGTGSYAWTVNILGADVTAPGVISDLFAALNPSDSDHSIDLTWTAPGNDGSVGVASAYEVRYSTAGVIDDANFAAATLVADTPPTPATGGTVQGLTVTGLTEGTLYWWAMRAVDFSGNVSGVSNCPSKGTTGVVDVVSPFAPGNLTASKPTNGFRKMTVVPLTVSSQFSSVNGGSALVDGDTSTTWLTAPGSISGGPECVVDAQSIKSLREVKLHPYLWDSTFHPRGFRIEYSVDAVTWEVGADVTNFSAPGAVFTGWTIAGAPKARFIRIKTTDLIQSVADTYSSGAYFAQIAEIACDEDIGCHNAVRLRWTAPGDDDNLGIATRYDVRYLDVPITTANFATATPVVGFPVPGASGVQQEYIVSGFDPDTTYHFAMTAVDEAGNTSPVSSSVVFTTCAEPDFSVSGPGGRSDDTAKEFKDLLGLDGCTCVAARNPNTAQLAGWSLPYLFAMGLIWIRARRGRADPIAA
jgi:hypothetical protein